MQNTQLNQIENYLIAYFEQHGPFVDSWGVAIDAAHVRQYLEHSRSRFLLLYDRVKKLSTPGACILDIGTAYGALPLMLQADGYDVSGTEIEACYDVYTRPLRERGVPVHTCSLYEKTCQISENHYDVVVASEVFEHIFINIEAAVRMCSRFIAPGGVLIVTTPNLYALPNLFRITKGENICEPFPESPVYQGTVVVDNRCHPREPTMPELRHAMIANHLQIAETGYFNRVAGRLLKRMAYAVLPDKVCEHILIVGRKK
ncbi:MAG: methyltransferase domain-containing protein [Nitrospirae bacterium]|nr:methyltransferase domain-containing protein [Nitrospirota bacterium]